MRFNLAYSLVLAGAAFVSLAEAGCLPHVGLVQTNRRYFWQSCTNRLET
jgi:hypothetical protein